ncbi:MAG: hypothetical protein NEHIOOID_00199 [Holosporales bacterium]
MLRKISTWLDQDESAHAQSSFRRCDFSGCEQEGLYKAPKDAVAVTTPDQSWYWFCKHHVRIYNEQWNYYKGMNEDQAYSSYKNDVMWNRTAWPRNHGHHHVPIYDPFELAQANSAPSGLTHEEQNALYTFGLHFPFSAQELQLNYRELVKKNHPDLHKTQEAQEMIIKINHAYQILKRLQERFSS